MRYFTVFLFLAGLLAGCAAPQTVGTVTTAGTPALTEAETPSHMDTSTPTATVTETPTPTPWPTATPLDYPILSTPQEAPNLADMEVDQWQQVSPDGLWQAAGMVAWPRGDYYEYHEMLTVFQTSGSSKWVLVDAWYASGLGASYPAPVMWSQDGQDFYFSNQVTPDGCAAFAPKSLDLYRLTLSTGEVRVILPGNHYGVFLSPDEGLVAAFKQVTREFVIRDLDKGEEIVANLDPGTEYDAGGIVWSPEGDQLALTIANKPCAGEYGQGLFAASSSILRVDAQTGAVQTLIEEDDQKFETVAWDEPGIITLRDLEGVLWSLNVETGELIQQ